MHRFNSSRIFVNSVLISWRTAVIIASGFGSCRGVIVVKKSNALGVSARTYFFTATLRSVKTSSLLRSSVPNL